MSTTEDITIIADIKKSIQPKAKNRSFAQDVFAIFTGSAFSQIIAISATPVITRYFAPDAFGIFAVLLAIVSIVDVVATMRYDIAIVLPKDNEDAAALFWASIFFTTVVTVITATALQFGRDYIIAWYKLPELANYLMLLPAAIFFHGVFSTLSHWNTRAKNFKRVASAQINNAITANSVKIGSGIAGFVSAGGLIGGTIIGSVVSTAVLGVMVWKDDKVSLLKSFHYKKIKKNIVSYKRMPLLNSPASVLNMISQQLPSLLLAFFFSPVIAGFYALGYKLMKKPTQLIGNSIRKVFYQRACESRNETGSVKVVVENTFQQLLKMSLGVFAIAFALVPHIFGLVFGKEWADAGIFARWLIPWVFTGFLLVPMSSIVTVLGKEGVGVLFQLLALITRVSAILIGGLVFKNPLITIIMFSFFGVIYQIGLLTWIFKESKATMLNSMFNKSQIVITGIFVGSVLAIERYLSSNTLVIAGACILYVFYYLFLYKGELKLYINKGK